MNLANGIASRTAVTVARPWYSYLVDRQSLCPRCGYHLTDLIGSWEAAYPLRATCSECGLDFDCGRVLSPQLLGPVWCYEHSAAPSTSRWWATARMSLHPPRLCRELEIDHEVNSYRLIRFAALWLAIPHLALSALLLAPGLSGTPTYPWTESLREACWDFIYPVSAYLPPLLAPWGYSLGVPVGSIFGGTVYQEIPLSVIAALVYIPVVLMPLWTVLLDSTFRLARVRRLHLLRAFAYSLPGAALWMLGLVALSAAVSVSHGLQSRPWDHPYSLAAAAAGVYLLYHILWWQQFIARYLRLQHATAVLAVHFFMTSIALFAMAAMMFAWGLV
jgi:hypothetical protein